jgi:eukaryotic-like serine/threonine-protein kinase
LNTKRLILISLITLGTLVLSACSGSRTVSNNWHGLAADAERAYLSNGSLVYAVDLKTGKEVWHYPAEVNSKLMFYAAPVLTADGQLLIGSAGATHPFVSLDPATGAEKWAEAFTKGKGAWLASPLVLNETIYAPNTDGFLYILDLTGKEIADPIELTGALWSAPSTDGKLLYVASLNHFVHIIDLASNSIVGSIDMGGAVPSSPAVGNDGAYVGSFATTVEFLKQNGNHEIIANAGNWIWGAPVLDGETLFYADLDGKVYSLDAVSGVQNWSVQPDGPVVASLVVAGDQIYVGTESGTLFALDLEGKTVWEKAVGGKIYTTPVLSSDLILVAPYQADFNLAAYDMQGKQAWIFTPVTTK